MVTDSITPLADAQVRRSQTDAKSPRDFLSDVYIYRKLTSGLSYSQRSTIEGIRADWFNLEEVIKEHAKKPTVWAARMP